MYLAAGTKMGSQVISWVGNKGQTKPDFLASNFTFCTGISLHHLFNPSGNRKIPLEILIIPFVYTYATRLFVCTLAMSLCPEFA